jgi:hypothetical protein
MTVLQSTINGEPVIKTGGRISPHPPDPAQICAFIGRRQVINNEVAMKTVFFVRLSFVMVDILSLCCLKDA